MIQLNTETRDRLKEFGTMGETYDDVVERLCNLATEVSMTKIFLDTTGYTDLKTILKKRGLSK